MKNTIVKASLALVLCASAHAQTSVGFTNRAFPATPANGVVITDNAGTPLTGVNFGIGSFTGDALDLASIQSGFTSLGMGQTPDASPFFIPSETSTALSSSPQDDSPIFVVFYDGADLASSTAAALFQGSGAFQVEDPVLGASIEFGLQDSTLLFGGETTVDTTGINAPFNGFTNGVALAVPEPSSILLGILGGLTFVLRRKRK